MDQVTFANKALLRIGSKTISSLSENSEAANLVSEFYEESIKEVLSLYRWRKCIETSDLVQAAQEDDMPADYRFFLPSGICRIYTVLDSDLNEIEYICEGNYIYTNEENSIIKYIVYDAYLLHYPSELITACYMNLARKIMTRLGKSTQMISIVEQQYSAALLTAMKTDRPQRRKIYKKATSWGASRSSRLYGESSS